LQTFISASVQLSKFFLRTLAFAYIDHCSHEFNQPVGSVKNRVAYGMDVSDSGRVVNER